MREFENNPVISCAAAGSSSVQIAGAVKDERSLGPCAISTAGKLVQRSFGPRAKD
jgi:hypothetical protein